MLNRDPARKAEDAANRNKPLSELQSEVRSKFKPDALPRDGGVL